MRAYLADLATMWQEAPLAVLAQAAGWTVLIASCATYL